MHLLYFALPLLPTFSPFAGIRLFWSDDIRDYTFDLLLVNIQKLQNILLDYLCIPWGTHGFPPYDHRELVESIV